MFNKTTSIITSCQSNSSLTAFPVRQATSTISKAPTAICLLSKPENKRFKISSLHQVGDHVQRQQVAGAPEESVCPASPANLFFSVKTVQEHPEVMFQLKSGPEMYMDQKNQTHIEVCQKRSLRYLWRFWGRVRL